MSIENPLWGAPRIHGELLKLGFEVAQSSVAKYMVKRRGPPSQKWSTFLRNHLPEIAAMDLFVVDLLYAFVIIRLDRRALVWINVTTNPTAEWIARQITEAFPWIEAPRYLIRDRDCIYGTFVTRRLHAMGIRDKPIAPAAPWQNGFAERLIGSIRRECLNHIVVSGEAHLRRVLRTYAGYYNKVRTHRSLDKDAPISRPVFRHIQVECDRPFCRRCLCPANSRFPETETDFTGSFMSIAGIVMYSPEIPGATANNVTEFIDYWSRHKRRTANLPIADVLVGTVQ
jgi:hypothetical protein